ncbi:MAG TPA: acyloxyacyl hydrolase [Vicinamibacterales bacterium]
MKSVLAAAALLLVCARASAFAQQPDDTRTQYPRVLQNSYITINAGAIDQPFSQALLQPGFHATSIDVPRIDVRAVLFGHELNRFVSAQASYMRPLNYVAYTGVRAGDVDAHHVRVNFGAVTLKARAPLRGRLSVYGEGGLGFTSRTGFSLGDVPVVADAHYASVLAGGGIEYRLTAAWDLTGGVTLSPGRGAVSQPRTLFSSGGFRYTMRPLPADRVAANRDAGFIFPRQIVQVEYSSGTGYAVNDFVSRKVPIFWGGHARVDFGIAPHYERNVFHTRKVFAIDAGASAGFYRTRQNGDRFYTLSVYPLFRFTFLRARLADMYFAYSLAGPTYISKIVLDGLDTGRHFTFQDFMGIGWFAGASRKLNAGVKINHYSNGNIFTQNAGVKIPLTFSVGYAF